MPEGYPFPGDISSDGESIMTLRFNGTNIFYDPTVETGDDIGDVEEEDYDSAAITISSSFNFVLIMSFVFNCVKFIF